MNTYQTKSEVANPTTMFPRLLASVGFDVALLNALPIEALSTIWTFITSGIFMNGHMSLIVGKSVESLITHRTSKWVVSSVFSQMLNQCYSGMK